MNEHDLQSSRRPTEIIYINCISTINMIPNTYNIRYIFSFIYSYNYLLYDYYHRVKRYFDNSTRLVTNNVIFHHQIADLDRRWLIPMEMVGQTLLQNQEIQEQP
jgi:hypothetical protein